MCQTATPSLLQMLLVTPESSGGDVGSISWWEELPTTGVEIWGHSFAMNLSIYLLDSYSHPSYITSILCSHFPLAHKTPQHLTQITASASKYRILWFTIIQCYSYNRISFSLRKEENSDTWYDTDEPWGHFAKGNKLVTKRLYDSTYTRYIE